MKLCRFQSGLGVSLGVVEDEWMYDLTSADPLVFRDLNTAYDKAGGDIAALLTLLRDGMKRAKRVAYDERLLKIPLQRMEIWGAGVTYMRSRDARETETKSKGIYDHIYSAVRPELFVKDTGIRCRGPGDEVSVRSDSAWTVPEPELTVVFDERGAVFGYTVGNDVSSRDIEGENPLYLPQAKVYRGSSAIGPVIATFDEVRNPQELNIAMRILRGGGAVFEGTVNTSQMKRSLQELADYLKKDNVLRTFTLLMTGTSIVPPDDFSLREGDVVEIEIEKIGVLRNRVAKLR